MTRTESIGLRINRSWGIINGRVVKAELTYNELRYREAEIEDITHIVELHDELTYDIQRQTRDDYWNFDEINSDKTADYIMGFYHSPNSKIYVAEYEDKIIGFIMGEVVKCHLPISLVSEVGYISAAYIRKEYRRNGIMLRLEEELSYFFKNLGLQYVEVNFLQKNTGAKKCWEAMGYNTFREQARKKLI